MLRGSSHGQGMVEFGLTFGILMALAVASAQVAILLHYAGNLDTAAREGAFQAALAGHGPADGETAARQLWAKLEPGAPLTISVRRNGREIVVSAAAAAPALLPSPVPPFTHFDLSKRVTHHVETFQPGSGS